MQNVLIFLIGLCPILFVCVCVGSKWHFNMYLGKISSCSCIVLHISCVYAYCVWWNAQMAFCCYFGFRWVPNFGDYYDYACLSCFDHWLRVLYTLTHACSIMPWSCITYAHHMHTWCTHLFTWHVLHFPHARFVLLHV